MLKIPSALCPFAQWAVVFKPQSTPRSPCQHWRQHISANDLASRYVSLKPCCYRYQCQFSQLLPFPWLQRSGWTVANRWCCDSPSSSCLCRSSYRCRNKVPRRLPLQDTSRQPDTSVSFLHWPSDHRRARFSPPTVGSVDWSGLQLCGKRPLLLLLPLCCCDDNFAGSTKLSRFLAFIARCAAPLLMLKLSTKSHTERKRFDASLNYS